MKNKFGVVGLFTLWFGAAVSLAEMMTGSLIAPLGLKKGILLILSGHIFGGIFLALAGYIGYKEQKPSLQTSRFSLGRHGSYLISILNITQLIGWTAIMLIQAAKAMQPLSLAITGYENFKIFVIFLGFLVLFWSLTMEKGLRRINEISVLLLMILCIVMIYLSTGQTTPQVITGSMSTGFAFELSLIMPLSWAPLIADYTQHARSSKSSIWGCFWGYFIGSSLMYIIGLTCALNLGSTDPTGIMLKLNLGFAALLIIILATVTTTFMDIYSAVISTTNIFSGISRNYPIIVYSIIGTLLALYFPMEEYENFLYVIGSVFAPTFTVLFIDYFLFKKDHSHRTFNKRAFFSIALGIFFYYFIQRYDLTIGSTLPTVVATTIIYILTRQVLKKEVVVDLLSARSRDQAWF